MQNFLVGVDYPQTGQDENVVPGGTVFPNAGLLCRCSGTATYATPTYLSAIYIKNSRGSTTPPDEQDTIANKDWIQFVGGFHTNYAWNANSKIPAFYEDHPAADNNALRAVAQYYPAGGGTMLAKESTPKPFRGKRAASCTGAAAPAFELTRAKLVIGGDGQAGASVASAETRIGPTGHDECWLLYQGFSVAFVGAGNVLMRNGQPLKASRIAVSAPRVAWWHGAALPRFVSRARGDGVGEVFHRFPTADPNAIVVWQVGSPLLPCGVVTSDCREHPDMICVDPAQEIRVQVNAAIVETDALSGSFELWVKVID